MTPATSARQAAREDRAGRELAVRLEQLVQLVRRLSPSNDLSLTAAAALLRLDEDGPTRLSDLAEFEGVSQPAMTQLVTRLEHDGLATRARHASDGRVVLVDITDAGRRLLAARRDRRAAMLSAMLHDLGVHDADAIEAALPALQRLATLALDF